MTRPLPLLLLLPALLAAGSASADDLAPLLRRLAEHEARVDELQKHAQATAVSTVEELDRKGKVESTTVETARISWPDGKQRSELVSMVKDGKDVTAEARARRDAAEKAEAEERRKAASKKGGEKSISVSISTPFPADQQAKYRFTDAGPDPKDPARRRIRFAPAGERTPEVNEGEALVDVGAGQIVAIALRPSKYPKFVDRMTIQLTYGTPSPAGPLPSGYTIEGEGGFLFVHKSIRTTTKITDWKW